MPRFATRRRDPGLAPARSRQLRGEPSRQAAVRGRSSSHGLPQVLWPVHCVQGTRGAELHAEPRSRADHRTCRARAPIRRSTATAGFFDNGKRKATGLAEWLRERGITELYVLGLATDYCVKFTALDARELGLRRLAGRGRLPRRRARAGRRRSRDRGDARRRRARSSRVPASPSPRNSGRGLARRLLFSRA